MTDSQTHSSTLTNKTQLAGLSSFVAANVIWGNEALIKPKLKEDWTGKAGEQVSRRSNNNIKKQCWKLKQIK